MARTLKVEPIIEYRLSTKELRRARTEAGLSVAEMVRRIKWITETSYRSMESRKKEFTQLSQIGIEDIAKALGDFKINANMQSA